MDNVVAFGVTAGILIFGSYYYYSIVRVPDNVQKSLDLKKKLTQAVKKPVTSSSNGASRRVGEGYLIISVSVLIQRLI